ELITKVAKFTESNSHAKRLIKQGAVYLNGDKVTDKELKVDLSKGKTTLKAGKKICQITLK
ncbi:MAG: S4 domain-containing protein, partial [bacterium]